MLLDSVCVVDGSAHQVGHGETVHCKSDAAEFVTNIAIEFTIVKEKLITQASAATRGNSKTQYEVVAAFRINECLGLNGSSIG